MSEQKPKLRLEIGHVLFLDIVGYSKLLISEQSAQLQKLKEIVRGTEQFRSAKAEGKLLRLPTGDGGALVFRTSPEAPVECAQEISRALKAHPELRVRMGIHSGPVNEVSDLNEQLNMAGAGINFAQRVMDCGDAGHILLSKHVADDIDDYPEWRPHLHDLGHCEVKHGVRVHLFNLYGDDFGNPALPQKVQSAARLAKKRSRAPWLIAAMALALAVVLATMFWQRAHRSSSLSARAVPEKSIAVLPFENLSRDPDNAYFADGVQDEILTDLAKVADLKVISRTSVMPYKTGSARNLRKIGQELGVAHVVEGSVQRASNKVRVNVQLIDARNDHHEWAENYDRDLADVFAIQSEIARTIADQLQAKLSPNEKTAIEERPTSDVIAFDEYTKARTLILTDSFQNSPRNLFEAVDLLNSAVARDPAFHLAYCELVAVNDRLYTGADHTPARLEAAETALKRAIELRPEAPETHLAHGIHLYNVIDDDKAALTELEAARAGLPNEPRIPEFVGYALDDEGKSGAEARGLERAMALDPRNPDILYSLSIEYDQYRRYPEEKVILQRLVDIMPDDLAAASNLPLLEFLWRADTAPLHQFVARVRKNSPTKVGEIADNWFLCALAERDWPAAEQALTALGDNYFWAEGDGLMLSRKFGEGLLARAMHDETRARSAFAAARLEQEQKAKEQKDYASPLCILGLIDAALGNKPAALEEGRRALKLNHSGRNTAFFAITAAWAGEKDLAVERLAAAVPKPTAAFITSYGALKLLPFWDPLRGDPRFEKIVTSLAPKDVAINSLQHLLEIPGESPLSPALLRLDPLWNPLRSDPRFQKLAASTP